MLIPDSSPNADIARLLLIPLRTNLNGNIIAIKVLISDAEVRITVIGALADISGTSSFFGDFIFPP